MERLMLRGSNLSFFNKNGIIEPESVPHKTIKTKETATVITIKNPIYNRNRLNLSYSFG
jgi:hypothetical protein